MLILKIVAIISLVINLPLAFFTGWKKDRDDIEIDIKLKAGLMVSFSLCCVLALTEYVFGDMRGVELVLVASVFAGYVCLIAYIYYWSSKFRRWH